MMNFRNTALAGSMIVVLGLAACGEDDQTAETATEKLNTRPDTDAPPRSGDETTRRGSGPGVSAQDLLRREGRL